MSQALIFAVRQNNVELVREWLARSEAEVLQSIHSRDEYERTPLFFVAQHDNAEIARLLPAAGSVGAGEALPNLWACPAFPTHN